MQLRKIVFFAIIGMSTPIFSQQDIFNVPDMRITPKGKFFVQEQNISYPGQLQSDTTLLYGLGNNFEIGINAYNFFYVYRKDKQPFFDPVLYYLNNIVPYSDLQREFNVGQNLTFNLQKRWDFTDWFSVSLGGKAGGAYSEKAKTYVPAKDAYFLMQFTIPKVETRIYGGGYSGNPGFYGTYQNARIFDPEISILYLNNNRATDGYVAYELFGNKKDRINLTGVMLGLDQPILKNKVHFICDFISGVNALGVSVWGLSYFVSENFSLNVGYQVPNPGSGILNPHAVLTEVNFLF